MKKSAVEIIVRKFGVSAQNPTDPSYWIGRELNFAYLITTVACWPREGRRPPYDSGEAAACRNNGADNEVPWRHRANYRRTRLGLRSSGRVVSATIRLCGAEIAAFCCDESDASDAQ